MRFANDIVQMNVLNSKQLVLPNAVVADNGESARDSRRRQDGGIRKFQSSFYSNDCCFDDLFSTERNDLKNGLGVD